MNNSKLNVLLIRWRWPLLGSFAGAALIAYLVLTYYEYRFPSWNEKVTLHDGRVIDVFERRDVIDGYGTRTTWLTLDLPELGGKQTWEESLRPVIIGVEAGKVYIVGSPRGPRQFSKYKFPKYAYVAFLWDGSKFKRIPFLEVPSHLRAIENIRWCLPGGQDSREPAPPSRTLGWCVFQPEDAERGYAFLRPKVVDLNERQIEGAYYARLAGFSPSSE